MWHISRNTGIFSGSKPLSQSSISLLGYRISSCAGAYMTPGCPVVTAKSLAARYGNQLRSLQSVASHRQRKTKPKYNVFKLFPNMFCC